MAVAGRRAVFHYATATVAAPRGKLAACLREYIWRFEWGGGYGAASRIHGAP